MDTENWKAKKEALAWLDWSKSAITSSSEVVILGFGEGLHVRELQAHYPLLEIIIVEPRIELFEQFTSSAQLPLRYVSTDRGLESLQIYLRHTENPVPILCFRPSWQAEQAFFKRALIQLTDQAYLNSNLNKPSAFVLESLFR